MYATVQALFAAVRLGLQREQSLFAKLRLHFVGTSYSPKGAAPQHVLDLAMKEGIGSQVTEQTARIPYLDSLQVMLDSHALFLVGSDEPHYTASKIFPYVLSGKPLLAIFHEASSVMTILRETEAGSPIGYDEVSTPGTKVKQIAERLDVLLRSPRGSRAATNWASFERYTARAMTQRLASSFNNALKSRLIPTSAEMQAIERSG